MATTTATILVADAEREPELTRAVIGGGGRIVTTGDEGVMAAFASASEAVNAAVGMLRDGETGAGTVRVGLAAGDVSWVDDVCVGRPVDIAAALHAIAGGSEIVLSNSVRLLAGDHAHVAYEPHGVHRLEGAGEPVEAYTVSSVPTVDHAGTGGINRPPLPLALAVRAGHRLVGREGAMDVIRDTWAESRRGPGRIVLIGGEAGAGKTRIATEVAADVYAATGCVLHGGCDADLSLPYQPWVQAIDQLLPVLRDSMSPEQATALAPLANLAVNAGWTATGVHRATLDAGAERYRTYAAFSAALAESAALWPTLVVLDDLHWAGAQTLALLRHIARSGVPDGVLVIGTFRDTSDEVSEPLAGCLADLRRSSGVVRLRLGNLESVEIERFVADAVGGDLDTGLSRLAEWLAKRSGGNPYYLTELWAYLVETGVVTRSERGWRLHALEDVVDVPESIRDVVRDRLSRLSDSARRFVEIAALGGQRIDLQVVGDAAGLSPKELDGAAGELLDAGLLVQVDSGAFVYRFAHALVSDTVQASIAPHARIRLHGRLAEAIEAVYGADRRSVLTELARHFAAAGGPADKVAYYGQRAGSQAIRAAAYDEAVAHLERALSVGPPAAQRCALLVLLGAARLRQGTYDESCAAQSEAFDLAVELDIVDQVVAAAVGFETAMAFPGLASSRSLDMLRTALAMVGDELTPARATVMASLGRALAFRGDPEGAAVAEEALRIARSMDDDGVLAVALQANTMASGGDDILERRLTVGAELEEVALRLDDGFSAAFAYANMLWALFAFGRFDEARDVLARHRAVSSAGHFATFEFLADAFDMQFALAAGDTAAAEAAAERARERGEAGSSAYDPGVYGLQMYAIRRVQGRLAEVAPALQTVASSPDAPPMWRPGLAALYTDLGMLDDARAIFESLANDGFAAVSRGAIEPASLLFLAETCIGLGDRARAEQLYDQLLAYRERNLQVGMTLCLGPADRPLGGLATLLGRHADADAHFRAALDLAARCGSPLWTTEVQYDWAIALSPRDPARAAELSAEALTTARALGIGRFADRPPLGGPPTDGPALASTPLPDDLSGREAEVLRLVATGRSNQQIAGELFISPNTVSNHVRAILRKTDCANRTEAALYATRQGLVDPSSS